MRNILVFLFLIISAVTKAQTIDSTSCDTLTPSPVAITTVRQSDSFVIVYGQSSTQCYTGFLYTPILVRGNTERRAENLKIFIQSQQVNFVKSDLINFARLLGVTNNIKFKFGIITYNYNKRSTEVKTQSENIR